MNGLGWAGFVIGVFLFGLFLLIATLYLFSL